MEKIDALLLELESLPRGYISEKKIGKKVYFYLQYKDGNKVVSKYVNNKDLPFLKSQLERRKEIENEIRKISSEGKRINTLSKTTLELTGFIMSGNEKVAEFDHNNLIFVNEKAPLIVLRTHDLLSFLSSRVLDTTRTNARLLKRILNIRTEDDYLISLKNHAVSITDNYWFKSKKSRLTYKDVCLESDLYHDISLNGTITIFPKIPKISPQFSLLGSYEKCWRKVNDEWWMYKVGTKEERYSEVISARLSSLMGIETAEYVLEDRYVKTKNFAVKYNFEPLSSLVGENDSNEYVFNKLMKVDINLAKQYLLLIWFDVLVNNIDRHNENVGLFRDKNTGKIVSLAPNFDLNMSLFSRSIVLSKSDTAFLNSFLRFVNSNKDIKEMYKTINLPLLDEEIIKKACENIDLCDYSFDLCSFLMHRYSLIKGLLKNI